jgi:adenosylcobinamide kinase/adenosylcobinamide-phosphate guanylyltransferase
MLTLILGGARSGKSRLAQKLAAAVERVVYIATADPGDDAEMASRIAHHRAERPASWHTIEETLALADAVNRAAQQTDVVLVDCLTVWLGNLFWKHRDAAQADIEAAARDELRGIAAASGRCHIILVSNELGSGTVPEHAVTRAFRDVHGLLNQWAAEAADEVILTVAGLPLYLKTANRTRND